MKQNSTKILHRLNRLEGQIRGISKMVQEDRYCVDILTQTAAAASALRQVEKLVIENHARHCIEEVLENGDRGEQRAKFMELIELLDRKKR